MEDKRESALVESACMLDALGIIANFAKEVLAVKLSLIKETYPDDLNTYEWFRLTLVDSFVGDNGKETKLKYGIAIQAPSMDEAPVLARNIVDEGYDMELRAVAKINFDKVIITSSTGADEFRVYDSKVAD